MTTTIHTRTAAAEAAMRGDDMTARRGHWATVRMDGHTIPGLFDTDADGTWSVIPWSDGPTWSRGCRVEFAGPMFNNGADHRLAGYTLADAAPGAAGHPMTAEAAEALQLDAYAADAEAAMLRAVGA